MNHSCTSEIMARTHQSRCCASKQLANKLKQLCKICIIGPKPQEVTAHSSSNLTQSPTGETEVFDLKMTEDLVHLLCVCKEKYNLLIKTIGMDVWVQKVQLTSLTCWWCFWIQRLFWTETGPVQNESVSQYFICSCWEQVALMMGTAGNKHTNGIPMSIYLCTAAEGLMMKRFWVKNFHFLVIRFWGRSFDNRLLWNLLHTLGFLASHKCWMASTCFSWSYLLSCQH